MEDIYTGKSSGRQLRFRDLNTRNYGTRPDRCPFVCEIDFMSFELDLDVVLDARIKVIRAIVLSLPSQIPVPKKCLRISMQIDLAITQMKNLSYFPHPPPQRTNFLHHSRKRSSLSYYTSNLLSRSQPISSYHLSFRYDILVRLSWHK